MHILLPGLTRPPVSATYEFYPSTCTSRRRWASESGSSILVRITDKALTLASDSVVPEYVFVMRYLGDTGQFGFTDIVRKQLGLIFLGKTRTMSWFLLLLVIFVQRVLVLIDWADIRMVNKFSQGRVFVAGDGLLIYLGQGLNSGLQLDAVNRVLSM
ncbi:hypothetical protein F4604DRAFT_1025066 [Suillus subluteus]|nr:hypothetical protein F4604DRAFT_1025066 [Suillus subluteus]